MKGKNSEAHSIRRRVYLGVAAGAGLTGFAGYGLGMTASTAWVPSRVPEAALEVDGWEYIGRHSLNPAFEQSVDPASVSTTFEALVYEDMDLSEALKEKTLRQVEGQSSLFFATHVTLDPSLSNLPKAARGTVVSVIRGHARASYEGQLENVDVADVEQTGTRSTTAGIGESARVTEHEAIIAFDEITFPFAEEEKFTIEGQKFGVSGMLAAWKHDGMILVADDVHPDENIELSVTKESTEAIKISVDIGLGLMPNTYREELQSLVAGVE